MRFVAAAIGIWTCIAPWVVAGDVAHTRSITNNLITCILATLFALAAASGARDHDTNGQSPASRRPLPGVH
ncbi:SPW repeat domain-containing protein [Streptomyces virginiae]|uniref:SPW repeat domain-containing protein n=1 Tax=Streptomyces virginiae TaxID=1961 RepID=UPI0037946E5E